MDIAFAAVFSFALILTIFSIVTIEDDMNQKSWRPIIILIFGAVVWISSAAILATPTLTTTSIPSYTIISSGSTITVGAYNITSSQNAPPAFYALLEYGSVAGAMAIFNFLLLFMYMTNKGLETIIEGTEDILDK